MMARLHGATAYIVHMTCREAVEALERAKGEAHGAAAATETSSAKARTPLPGQTGLNLLIPGEYRPKPRAGQERSARTQRGANSASAMR